jgi:L-ectoine synthase
MACVFNPPVTGREVHDENGVYPLLTDEPNAHENEEVSA